MCPLPFPTSPSPAFGTNNNNNNNNKGEFYEREGKSLFKNYQVEQQQQQYLTNDDYNSPHNNSPPQSPQPFYSQQQPPQQPPQQQHHHHQQQYQQQQEDQIVTPQEFKRYYHLRQSPFEVVRAEATDPGVRERCLIPNLQVLSSSILPIYHSKYYYFSYSILFSSPLSFPYFTGCCSYCFWS